MRILLACLILFLFSSSVYAAQITLAWDAVDSATGYKLYYGHASGHYDQSVDVGNVTQYTLTGLGSGAYFFAVTAYDADEESGYSNEVNYTFGVSSGLLLMGVW